MSIIKYMLVIAVLCVISYAVSSLAVELYYRIRRRK